MLNRLEVLRTRYTKEMSLDDLIKANKLTQALESCKKRIQEIEGMENV
jgi:hypothetical protein